MGTAPLQEFRGVFEPEGRVVVLNVVCGQEFVHLFQLDNAVGGDKRVESNCSPERGH